MPLIKTLISRKIDPNYSFSIGDNNCFYLTLINLALLQFLPSVVVTDCNILIFNLVLQHRLMKYPHSETMVNILMEMRVLISFILYFLDFLFYL